MSYLMKAEKISAPTSTTYWTASEVDTDMSEHYDGAIVPSAWTNHRVVAFIEDPVAPATPTGIQPVDATTNLQTFGGTTLPSTPSRVDPTWNKV